MKVLIVDDDSVTCIAFSEFVVAAGHEFRIAENAAAGLAVLARETVDVVICDWEMPGGSGLDLIADIRSRDERYVYIILATGFGSRDEMRLGIEAGADDYLVKPVEFAELQRRLIVAERVAQLHRRLESKAEQLQRAARTDPLTMLGNRLQLEEYLSIMTDRVERYGHRFGIAMIDVDCFKGYNDTYGHSAGDQVLWQVADTMNGQRRASDSLYRYGGDEFLLICAEQTPPRTQSSAERIRSAIAALNIPHRANPPFGIVTVSVGIAVMERGQGIASAMDRADTALYRSKEAGRNTISE